MNEAHAMSSPIPDRDTDYDFIISGYGPAGATLANLLGQRGWRVAVAGFGRILRFWANSPRRRGRWGFTCGAGWGGGRGSSSINS